MQYAPRMATKKVPDDPDDPAIREHVQRLADRLSRHTVPIVFIRSAGQMKGGSGVLLTVGSRDFVLTAGHCVAEGEEAMIMMGVKDEPHQFTPKLQSGRYATKPEDFGFWEIAKADADHIRACGDKVFLTLRNLALGPFLPPKLIFGGYPVGAYEFPEPSLLGWRLTTFFCFITGIGGFITGIGGVAAVEESQPGALVLVRPGGRVTLVSGSDTAVEVLPEFPGASGGGYWYFAESTLAGEDEPILVATHVGSAKTPFEMEIPEAGISLVRSSRGILTLCHVALIASTYPELKPLVDEAVIRSLPRDSSLSAAVVSRVDAVKHGSGAVPVPLTQPFARSREGQLGPISTIRFHGESRPSFIVQSRDPQTREAQWRRIHRPFQTEIRMRSPSERRPRSGDAGWCSDKSRTQGKA